MRLPNSVTASSGDTATSSCPRGSTTNVRSAIVAFDVAAPDSGSIACKVAESGYRAGTVP